SWPGTACFRQRGASPPPTAFLPRCGDGQHEAVRGEKATGRALRERIGLGHTLASRATGSVGQVRRSCEDVCVVTDGEWERLRGSLRFGQVFRGTVVKVPRPGTIGIFVDIGLDVGGFVDGVLLPEQAERWPAEGTVTDFEIWWADDRQQVRLKP